MGGSSSKVSAKEKTRQQRTIISRYLRDLEQKKKDLYKKEAFLLKKLAMALEKNDTFSIDTIARDIHQLRKLVGKYTQFESQLYNVDLRLSSIATTESTVNILKESSKITGQMMKDLKIHDGLKTIEKGTAQLDYLDNVDQMIMNTMTSKSNTNGLREDQTSIQNILDEARTLIVPKSRESIPQFDSINNVTNSQLLHYSKTSDYGLRNNEIKEASLKNALFQPCVTDKVVEERVKNLVLYD